MRSADREGAVAEVGPRPFQDGSSGYSDDLSCRRCESAVLNSTRSVRYDGRGGFGA